MSLETAKHKDDIYVLGIHILFGIVIGLLFTEFHDNLFPFDFSFKTALIVTSLVTILLSWIGYNSIVKMTGHGSIVLFAIDIAIVFFYFQMVYSVDNSFSQVILSLSMIFTSYTLWYPIKDYYDKQNWNDAKKIIEGKSKSEENKEESESLGKRPSFNQKRFAVLFVSTSILFVMYSIVEIDFVPDSDPIPNMITVLDDETGKKVYGEPEFSHWIILVVMWIVLFVFRFFDPPFDCLKQCMKK